MFQKDTVIDKAALRKLFRARRAALPPEDRARLSGASAQAVMREKAWHEARTVALYMAVRGETDCGPLLEAALQSGKCVLLPRCSPERPGEMRFAACHDPAALAPGAYGIPEPAEQSDAPAPTPDIIVVPGVAFDREGFRLGAGGGYYDRLLCLPGYAASLRLGLAYGFQVLDSLPREPWDVPVHALATERGVQWMQTA